MGVIRRIARRFAAHGIDYVNRRVQGAHRRVPPPAIWGLDATPSAALRLHGHDLGALAAVYGTPLHVVDRERLVRNFQRFHRAFATRHPSVVIGYSYKTNPLPGVLRVLHDEGAFAEVISHFELWLALRLGVPAERIIFNGPGKTQESLELAVSRGIFMINIDGPMEIDAIERLAARHGCVQPVAIRVVTSVGWSAQFGMPLQTGAALEAARRISHCRHLRLKGLHVHLGTGIADVGTYLQAIGEVLDFGDALERDPGIKVEVYDFGGGFGVPTVRKFDGVDQLLLDHELPSRSPHLEDADGAEAYAAAIAPLLARRWGNRSGPGPTIVFEPGRAITSSAQFMLMKVLALKPNRRGNTVAIVDAGRNHAMPPSWEYHALLHASRPAAPGAQLYDVYGPLCHPGDLMFRGRWLPELTVGDVLAVMDAGAYFIPNQMNFSNPRAAAVMVSPGEVALIRERERFEDIVQLDGAAMPEAAARGGERAASGE